MRMSPSFFDAGGRPSLASLLTAALEADTAGSQIAAALDSDQQEELTAQLRGEGIALPYELLLDLDLTAQATDDWSGLTAGVEGAKTLAGMAVKPTRNANTSAFGIVNGQGLVITNTGSGGSQVDIPLSEIESGDYDPATDRLIIIATGTCANLNTTSGAIQLVLISDDDNEAVGAQLVYSSPNWILRGFTKRGGSQVTGSAAASQGTAPASFRHQIGEWKGGGTMHSDMGAGNAMPATLDTLTHRADLVRYAQTAGAAQAVDIAAPQVRMGANGGNGSTITFKGLRVYRVRSVV